MDAYGLFFGLLRIAVCGATVTEEIAAACTPENLQVVYALAIRHDLAHLVGQAISKLQLPESQIVTQCKQSAMQAFGRYMQLNFEYERTCQALEQAQIPFIPLKGSVIRNDYPEPWMRTSCDMDILVKEEQLETAVAALTENLGYVFADRTDHDVLLKANGVYLELHYDTIQQRYETGNNREVLSQMWEDATPVKPGSYHYVLSDAMFYFYHIAHMVKHFKNGGCGVRAFLDLWILDRKQHDTVARQALLEEGELLKFAQGARELAEYWFSGHMPSEMTRAVSDYILRAGVYGDKENRAAVGQAKMGGKLRYLLLRRVFMPYDYLKAEYPVLKKHKWLTPLYQVVRWMRMLRQGRLRHTAAEWKANTRADKDSVASVADILKYMDI